MAHNVLDLKKTFVLNLEKAGITPPTLCARLACDRSGSMDDLFRSGWVDNTVDLFIGAALKFDDNGELEMGFFNDHFEKAPNAVESDGGKYMRTKGKHVQAGGGTNFAPVIEALAEMADDGDEAVNLSSVIGNVLSIFGKKKQTKPEEKFRSYAGIITDGDNADGGATLIALQQASDDTFFQFIGIGNAVNRSYLDKLASRHKNVGVVYIADPRKITPDGFYKELCNDKFASWIKSA